MLGFASKQGPSNHGPSNYGGQTAAKAPLQRMQPAKKPGRERHKVAQVIHQLGALTKLRLGAARDEHEQEADRTAEQVVNTPDHALNDPAAPAPAVQPLSGSQQSSPPAQRLTDDGGTQLAEEEQQEEEPERLVQTEREAGADDDTELSGRLGQRILALQGRGQPLPASVRAYMEPRFGQDFSGVRIHTDREAAELSQTINAHAFTLGEHIAFGEGAYRPDTDSGKKLIAHELTHVVQQRGGNPEARKKVRRLYIPGVSEVVEFVGDAVESAGEFLADQGWRLVRRYAPWLEPILRQGPLNWLKDKVSSAFDGIVATLNRLNPGPILERLGSTFSELVERAGTIIQALLSGDCEPLFAAIRQLKNFVTEVAGTAWNHLVDFLRPVGDFFSDLWDSIGAPAVEWLSNFAGDLWADIRQLGADIWEWTRPVRDAVGAAWNWIKEKLFGSDSDSSGNSEGGLVSWIMEKAGQAWDWVKERTRPVWEPIQQGVQWLRELIPPAFVRNLGENMTQLSQNLGQAEQQMGGDGEQPGGNVAQNREALAAALPSLQQVLASVRGIIVGARDWLGEKVGGLRDKVLTFFTRLRGNSITSGIARALSWLESGVRTLGNWAQRTVAGLFNWLIQGFDFLTPFIERVVGVVRQLINVASDLLQLPQMILSSVWNLIPACIRDPIKDFVVEQILSRIPVFGQLFQIPDLWQRVQATALRILQQVFVDGNIPGAAWTFFQAMLRLIGLPPELVVQVLAKAAGAIGHILTDPFGFITNALRATWLGFSNFFSNIGQHLLGGITGWLFGHMREGGIEPPRDLSLRSMLGVVLQVLDITVDRVFSRLARRIGRENVDRLRRMLDVATGVWSFVRILVEEGPGGLWREVQERLSNLGTQLLNSVISWVTTTIITRVSARLLTMLDPSGIMAVINSIVAFYRAIQSFVEHLREMLEIANSVLDGINGIATGALAQAANFLENALSRAIPVAIGFLANQVGLRNFGNRIQEMVEGIRERVDGAIDWLIDRAIRVGRGVLNMIRRGASAVRRGVARVREWWRTRKPFRAANGDEHSLYIRGSGRGARLMIASDPKTYEEFIRDVDVPADKQSDKTEAMGIAREVDEAIETAASSDNRQTSPAGTPQNDTTQTDHAAAIDGLLERLGAVTARFMPVDASNESSPPIYGGQVHGFGSSVSVARLTHNHPDGSGPSATGGHWEALRRRKDGGGSYYVRGHLLNDNLGGPGNTWDNLTPLTQGANNRDSNSMLHRFETPVKNVVEASNENNRKVVNFVVTANYGFSHPLLGKVSELRASGNPDDDVIADIIEAEQYVPRSLDARAHEVSPDGSNGRAVATHTVDNRFDTSSVNRYQLTEQPQRIVYLNEMSRDELLQLNGIGEQLADAIIEHRPFRTREQIRQATHIADGRWNQMQATPGFHVRIYQL